MAKITIIEQDNSSVSTTAITENIIYVPGYAIKGPVNKPVLCTSYSSFISKFGDKPYVFKSDQIYNGAKVASVGDFEKSYVYAAELLKSGLPILFERIASEENTNKASLKINFRDVSLEGSYIVDNNYFYFIGEKDASDITVIWKVYKSDNSEEPGNLVESSSYTLSSSTDNQEITFKFDDGENTYGPVSIPIQATTALNNESNYFTIKSKYVGEYGKNTIVNLLPASSSTFNEKYFVLTVNGSRYIISFDSENALFIQKEFADNEDIDIELNLSQDFIKSGLYDLDEITNETLKYESTGDEVTISEIYAILKGDSETESAFDKLKDKRAYDVKFITSGAYANLDNSSAVVAQNMLDTAATRTDALALVDIAKGVSKDNYLALVKNNLTTSFVNGEDRNLYGTVIAPNVKISLSTTKTNEWMPGSFIYLKSLASSLKVNPIWFAIAGVNRALISDFKEVEFDVSGALLDTWQSDIDQNINPIMNIRPYGYCIYGNRTLKKNINGLTSNSFTNVRVLVNEIKKLVIQTASSLTYEANDVILLNNFKAAIQPSLDQMVSNRGLTDYKIIRETSNKKGTFKGTVRIMPIEAVENFDITFTLEDSTASVE